VGGDGGVGLAREGGSVWGGVGADVLYFLANPRLRGSA
jgi:hypothetical protein